MIITRILSEHILDLKDAIRRCEYDDNNEDLKSIKLELSVCKILHQNCLTIDNMLNKREYAKIHKTIKNAIKYGLDRIRKE